MGSHKICFYGEISLIIPAWGKQLCHSQWLLCKRRLSCGRVSLNMEKQDLLPFLKMARKHLRMVRKHLRFIKITSDST